MRSGRLAGESDPRRDVVMLEPDVMAAYLQQFGLIVKSERSLTEI